MKYYYIIVYTASEKCYADSVLDYLEQDTKYFEMRLYRSECVKSYHSENEFVYIKDLRILSNLDLDRAIIIDNSVFSFAFHLENGIPILPYYKNPHDLELECLTKYLIKLSKFSNIRTENDKNFKLSLFYQDTLFVFKEDNTNENTDSHNRSIDEGNQDSLESKASYSEEKHDELVIIDINKSKPNQQEFKYVKPIRRNTLFKERITNSIQTYHQNNENV